MAALLCKWLNSSECNLSVHIKPSSFEAQFSNGYYAGELLAKAYHARRLQLMDDEDFSRFNNKSARTASINNYLLLQPILRSMQIALPVDQVRRIVIEERGAALDLLFKIRLALSRHDGKFPKVKVRKFEASIFNIHRDEKPPQPMWTKATDLYDTIVDPKKTVAERDMGIHLVHFEDSQNQWEEHCAQMEVYETLQNEMEWKERNDLEKTRLKEKTEWGLQEEENQKTRHYATQQRQMKNVRSDFVYELSAMEKTRRKVAMKKKIQEIDLDTGISWFERNRKRLGVGGDDDDDDDGGGGGDGDGAGPEQQQEKCTPIEHLAKIEAATAPVLKMLAVPARNYMKKLHGRALEEKQNRKDRGARQRKQAVDQKNASVDAEEGKHKAALLLSVESTSRAERDRAKIRWEKRIRISLLEESKEKERKAKDLERSRSLDQYFETLASETMAATVARSGEEEELRATLRANLEERSRLKLLERAKWMGKGGLVTNLVELALIVVTRQNEELSLGRDGVVERGEWRNMKREFVRGANLREYSLNSGGGSGGGGGGGEEGGSGSGSGELVERQMDVAERYDFLSRRGDWSPSEESGDGGSVEREEDGAAESTAAQLQQMGQLLNYLCDPLEAPEIPLVTGTIRVGMVVMGAPSILSNTNICEQVAKRTRSRVISIESTLEAAARAVQNDEEEAAAAAAAAAEDAGAAAEDAGAAAAEENIASTESSASKAAVKSALVALGSDPSSEELLATALTAQVKEVAEDVESSGWILKGWPATELQAKMLEFVLEGPMTGGVPWEKASGPKSKWKPPSSEDAKSVVGIIVEVMEELEEVEVKVEEEVAGGEEATEAAEAESEEVAPTAEEIAAKERDEEWLANRTILLETWYADRCDIGDTISLKKRKSNEEEENKVPTLETLQLDQMFGKLHDRANSHPQIKVQEGEGEQQEGEQQEDEQQEEDVTSTTTTEEQSAVDTVSPSNTGTELATLLTRTECRVIQQNVIEDAILRGDANPSDVVHLNVMRDMFRQWSNNESSFNTSVLPVFRTLRNGDIDYEARWSEARSTALGRLTDASVLERIVHLFNERIRSVNSERPYDGRTTKRLRKELQDEMDEVIDSLYSVTSEKQRDAERMHTELEHSDWPSARLASMDKALALLVESYGDRIVSVSHVVVQYFRVVEGKFRQARAELVQRRAADEEEAARKKAAEAAEGQEEEEGGGGGGGDDLLPDVSPSALPTTESQLRPTIETREDEVENGMENGTEDGTMVNEGSTLHQQDELAQLRVSLPTFVTSCIQIQSKLAAVSDSTEPPVSLPSVGSYTSPSLTNVSERILKQLHGSVDLFVSAIIQQAQRRVESTKGRHENTVKELDDWIGSVVAAETASVGQMRKSMQMSIAAALETDGGAVPEGADQNLRVQMRYGVDVPDDGPTIAIFDVRGPSSTLRSPSTYLLPTPCLRMLIQGLRSAALEGLRSSSKKSGAVDPLGSLSRSTFVDVVYKAASSGHLTEIWSSLSRNTFVQIAQQFDPTSTGSIRWREFCLTLIYSLMPKKNGIPNVTSLRKMYSAFVRADDMSPTQSSADVVEWNEYCSVPLWFEEDARVDEEIAWQLRDLMWLIFSENPTSESRGVLAYPAMVLALSMTPYAGEKVHRSIGLFKAFQVQSVVSQCRAGTLSKQATIHLLSQRACNPVLSDSIVNEIVCEAFAECLEEDDEISFDTLVLSIETIQTNSVEFPSPLPFTLKNVFQTLRSLAMV